MINILLEKKANIIVFLTLFITTWLNYVFNNGTFESVCFCLAIGFAIGFYFYGDRKTLLYITSGILIGSIFSRLIYVDEIIISSILKSIGFTVVNILIITVLKKVVNPNPSNDEVSLRNVLTFTVSTVVLSLFAALFLTIMTVFNEIELDLITVFLRFSTGFFFGIMIFGTIFLYILYYRENATFTLSKIIQSVVFIISFTVVASMLFSNSISWFSYYEYSYVLLLFYLIMAFVFSFRMILVINIIFVILYQYFFINLGVVTNFSSLLFGINTYLLVLSTTSGSVKMVLYELDAKNKALIKSTKKLESLVYSTDSLLKLSDDILNTNVKVQEDYLSRIFKIACNIFDNYDYAACYIKEDPDVNFISAVGYDVDILMSLGFKSDSIDQIDIENPVHIANEDKSLQRALKEKYDGFHKHYPIMTEAIRFGIYIDENTIGGISFDISKESGKEFLREEFENLKSFQKLMNSFFSINYLNYKNISLKNDIVLSLIRTLELFDQYTGGHSEEVAYLSKEISMRCGLDENETHDIYWAGVVHDIGKVGIDSSIINKPSRLSMEEYEIVKEHSMFGFEILNKAEDLKTIALLVKHHHEWWNGTGYPSELKGEDIPMGSQIIGLCDAVSTMARKRPYTVAKTSREIIEELEMYSGVQFSPEPTKRMIEFIEEGYLDSYYKNK